MKNSVNSKTFDEIFAQRGEQVQPENMVKGEYYINVDGSYAPHCCILRVSKGADNVKIFHDRLVFANGNFYGGGEPKTRDNFIACDADWDTFFKATPDQVELLNSYRPYNGTTCEKPAAL